MYRIIETAKKLYDAYCVAVGGKAYNGDPLPSWEVFYMDDNKRVQANAWIEAAKTTLGNTVTILIGNSDNKLTQQKWSLFIKETRTVIKLCCDEFHFNGGSQFDEPWQNACWVVIPKNSECYEMMKEQLTDVRKKYQQTSIAIMEGTTRFI